MKVLVIPPGADEFGQWHVLNLWSHYGKWFEAAAAKTDGQYSAAQYVEMAYTGKVKLWTFWDDTLTNCIGIGAAEIIRWSDDYVVAAGRYIAGERLNEWASALDDHFEPWARANGAHKIAIDGREGLEKFLHGYKVRSVIYEKELL